MLVDSDVPLDILPRRMRIEKIVGAVFQRQMNEDFRSWCIRNGMSGAEYQTFFAIVSERLGDRIISTDTDTMMHASQEALLELVDYLSKKNDAGSTSPHAQPVVEAPPLSDF
jgi:hypothetical protein